VPINFLISTYPKRRTLRAALTMRTEEAMEVESRRKQGLQSTKLNKYALACALLASTNSILLGYGNFNSNPFSLFVFSFLINLPHYTPPRPQPLGIHGDCRLE